MAEDRKDSPSRTRKMSWADMVEEEEEQKIAQEAYELALKERSEKKKKAEQKGSEQKKGAKQKKNSYQNKGNEQKTSVALQKPTEQQKTPEPKEVMDQQKRTELKMSVEGSCPTQVPITSEDVKVEAPSTVERLQEQEAPVETCAQTVQEPNEPQSAENASPSTTVPLPKDAKVEAPSTVERLQEQEAPVETCAQTVQEPNKPQSAENASPSTTVPLPKDVEVEAPSTVQRLQEQEAPVETCAQTVQEPNKPQSTENAPSSTTVPLPKDNIVVGEPSTVQGLQQQGASVEASNSETGQAPLNQQSAVEASSCTTDPLSKDVKIENPPTVQGSQEQEAPVKPSYSQILRGSHKQHSTVAAPSSTPVPYPKTPFHTGSKVVVQPSTVPRPQRHEASMRAANKTTTQAPPKQQSAVRASYSTTARLPKDDKVVVIPSSVPRPQRPEASMKASNKNTAQAPPKQHSAVGASSSTAASYPKEDKVKGETSTVPRGAPVKASNKKTAQAPPKEHSAVEASSSTKASSSTTAPVPKDDKVVVIPSSVPRPQRPEASLKASNKKTAQAPPKQHSAVGASSSTAASYPKESKGEGEPSTSQRSPQEAPAKSSNIKSAQAPLKQQSAEGASSSTSVPLPKKSKVKGEHSTAQRSPQEAPVKSSNSKSAQAPLKQQSAEGASSSTNVPLPKADGGSVRSLNRDAPPRKPVPLATQIIQRMDDKVEAPSTVQGSKEQEASVKPPQEPQKQDSAVEASSSTAVPFPKDKIGKSTTESLEGVPGTSSSRTLAVYKADTENPTTSNEDRYTWGDIGDEVSIISILKEERERLVSLREDLKTLVDDDKSFYTIINERLNDALIIFDTHQESAIREDKISYWKIRGLIFMESPKYAHHAIDAFTKAVKLEPSAIDCWNNMGDCYCSLGDLEMSKKCFLSALEQGKNIVSYQNLSILSRLKKDRELEDYQDGINYAKEALTCDITCIKSWAILGNAYMAAFFATAQNEHYIIKALHAYRQAEKGGAQDFELCNNKFVALKFLEYYEEALNTLLPSLIKLEVEWKEAQNNFHSLVKYLTNVQELINKKGKIRPKKRSEYVKQLKTRKPSENERDAEVDGTPRLTGIVIWILSIDASFPYTVGLLTDSEEIFAVSIFNLSTDRGFNIGDTMNVPISSRTQVDIHVCQHEFKFTKVRIFLPTDIILNGKRLSVKYLKPYEIHSN